MSAILYSDASCAPCKTMKFLLNRKGIEYEEREASENAAELIRLTGHTHPPVLVCDNKVITRPQDLNRLAV